METIIDPVPGKWSLHPGRVLSNPEGKKIYIGRPEGESADAPKFSPAEVDALAHRIGELLQESEPLPMNKDLQGWQVVEDRSGGGHLLCEVGIIPAKLVQLLGDGNESDGHKVSAQWFLEKDGVQFTLYDYKATTLYDAEGLRPSELWASKESFPIHVGGEDGHEELLKDFVAMLQATCGA